MPRKTEGIRKSGKKWQAYVWVHDGPGGFKSTTFDRDTPVAEMQAWRAQQVSLHGQPRRGLTGSFRADVERFLAKPEIADQKYVGQLQTMLERWMAELGEDRPRASITRDEIEAVLRTWLKRYKEPTVYHRRSALLLLYTTLDGPGAANPVKGTTCPKAWVPADHSVPYAKLQAIVDAMPDWRYVKTGIRQPSIAKLAARVIIAVGMRAVDLRKVRARHLDWDAATVLWPASEKGKGKAAERVALSPEGVAAFRAFDAAQAYGQFVPEAISHSFKRAARTVDGPDTPIHLYSLRHGLGADTYRATKDTPTVGRLLNHAPGSRATLQYQRGANADVDRAAVAAVSAARAAAIAPPKPPETVQATLQTPKKSRKRKHLRRVS